MACGLEVRVPMLDEEFVRWSLGLPLRLKLQGEEGKFLLKRALEPLLPHDVLYRKKQGFSVPLARWFRGALGEEFARHISSKSPLAEFIDLDHVRDLLSQHKAGWADNSRALWLIWIFDGFLQTFRKQDTALTNSAPSAMLHA